MQPVIHAETLGKRYVITHRRKEPYRSLRDAVAQDASRLANGVWHLLTGRSAALHAAGTEEFWALRDVDLEVYDGERLAIIGRNGAGKSTLLKILSRVSEPTVGRVVLRGRVASLLEVGTGFHPELTGRENVFLNGAILGMSRTEIARKFDEIVAFAEVERFLDTPVKRYSSGMYVRLAFAVAAHLEPEILIVDEVLAVGDAAFQRKCLGKMEDVSREGRTLLFVSHNMGAVAALCNRAILLDGGKVVTTGETRRVIDDYAQTWKQSNDLAHRRDRSGTGFARIVSISLENALGERVTAVKSREPFQFVVGVETAEAELGKQVGVVLVICDRSDNRLCPLYTEWTQAEFRLRSRRASFRCWLPTGLPLTPAEYWVTAGVLLGGVAADKLDRALEFEVLPALSLAGGAISGQSFGSVLVEHSWEQWTEN